MIRKPLANLLLSKEIYPVDTLLHLGTDAGCRGLLNFYNVKRSISLLHLNLE